MDPFKNLLEMGFSHEAVAEAQLNGCSSVAEVVEFICNQSTSKKPKTVAPLRLSRDVITPSGVSSAVVNSGVSDTSLDPSMESSLPQERTSEEQTHVQSRYKLLQPSLDDQREEARKLAAKLREEKRQKVEAIERIRNEMAQEKLERVEGPSPFFPGVSDFSGGEFLTSCNIFCRMANQKARLSQVVSTDDMNPTIASASSEIKIRISLPTEWLPTDTNNLPVVGHFNRSTATVGDLEELIQTSLNSATPDPSHCPLSIDLPCVALFTADWPRRRLPRSDRSLLLAGVGIVNNVAIMVCHDATICTPLLEAAGEIEGEGRGEDEEGGEEGDGEGGAGGREVEGGAGGGGEEEGGAELGGGEEVGGGEEEEETEEVVLEEEEPEVRGSLENEPQNNANYVGIAPPQNLPCLTRTPGRSGSAAIWRAGIPRRSACPDSKSPPAVSSTSIRVIRSLRDLSMNLLVSLVACAVSGGPRNDIHTTLDHLAYLVQPGCGHLLGVIHTLQSVAVAWPDALGIEFVQRLCREGLFNVRSALLLKNFICRLDLDYYHLVTSDLVICISNHWPGLLELRLKGLQDFQLSTHAVKQIGNLRNLRILHLDGLKAVNDSTIVPLGSLPHLRVLRVASTRVSDGGWEALALEANARRSGLRFLSISTTVGFTDLGLARVVQVFPELTNLAFAKTEVTGTAPILSEIPPLTTLEQIDANGCPNLQQLPPCLLGVSPPRLRHLRISACPNLSVGQLLSQLVGQPITRIDGFQSLPDLTAEHVLSLANQGFPLRELDLSQMRTKDLSFSDMSRFLVGFTVPTISRLLLPLTPLLDKHRPVADVDNVKRENANEEEEEEEEEQTIARFVRSLSGLTNLMFLDLGDQASRMTPGQLSTVGQQHRLLTGIVARNLTEEQEQFLRRSVPNKCKIAIKYTSDVAKPSSNATSRDIY